MKHIKVIGSINMDIILSSARLPVTGETIKADKYYMYPGGKGANQAVAVARTGVRPQLIGKLGNDYFAEMITTYLKKENIDLSLTYGDKTGIAMINVESSGKNMITVYPGSNGSMAYDDFHDINIKNSIVMFQQEIPLKTIRDFISNIAGNGNMIITDPSPFNEDRYILENTDILTPNENEAQLLAGCNIKNVEDAKKASRIILEKYKSNVIIKLGDNGSLINYEGNIKYFKPYKVETVDTTGAGDCFNGAFASEFLRTESIDKSMEFANIAGALSTTGYGAFPSFPYRNQIISIMEE
ncbi:MAG: ribokinase [Candidatus Thermoplasmatota archaeon]|nr:ribokinase [Candidatus Thermoplasmatota archaeon]